MIKAKPIYKPEYRKYYPMNFMPWVGFTGHSSWHYDAMGAISTNLVSDRRIRTFTYITNLVEFRIPADLNERGVLFI